MPETMFELKLGNNFEICQNLFKNRKKFDSNIGKSKKYCMFDKKSVGCLIRNLKKYRTSDTKF